MPEIGLFMIEDDVLAFDEALDCTATNSMWQAPGASRTGSDPYHESLVDALRPDGGTQAFLRVRGHGGDAVGPLIQYLTGRLFEAEESLTLRAGRLAYATVRAADEPHIDADTRAAFESLAKTTFSAARSVTLPHVVRHDRSMYRRYRIGRGAASWYLENPWPARQLRDMATIATYRLKTETV